MGARRNFLLIAEVAPELKRERFVVRLMNPNGTLLLTSPRLLEESAARELAQSLAADLSPLEPLNVRVRAFKRSETPES